MGVLGSICFLNVGGEDGPTEWSLPEFWEAFLEEAVPEDWEGVGFKAAPTGGPVLWLEGRPGGLDPDSEWSGAPESQFAHL